MPAQTLMDKKEFCGTLVVAGMNHIPSNQALVKSHDSYQQVSGSECSGRGTPTIFYDAIPGRTEGPLKAQNEVITGSPYRVTRSQWIAMFILTFVNLINYMDRYTVAGVLSDCKRYYSINDSQAGALQTVFIVSYMIFAPLFGYFGDRYSRKLLLVLGIVIWMTAVLTGSYMTEFVPFLLMRALVGIGEASYSAIAPTIISDMFVKERRTKMIGLFYMAIPIGSGLGYVAGQGLAGFFDNWQWSMRGTPIFGLIAIFLIIFCLEVPPRGHAEGNEYLEATSYKEDLISFAKNPSYVLNTIGYTAVSFCCGCLSWWGPFFLKMALLTMDLAPENRPMQITHVSFLFGGMTALSGLIGVPLGFSLSAKCRHKFPRADPLICGIGLSITAITFFIALFICNNHFIFALFLILVGEISLNLNWSIVTDVIMSVVVSTRRGSAGSWQILISHLFGDAGSPYLIGVISDGLKARVSCFRPNVTDSATPQILSLDVRTHDELSVCDAKVNYYSMQYALMINFAVVVIGAIFFYVATIFIVQDRLKAEQDATDRKSRISCSKRRDNRLNLTGSLLSSGRDSHQSYYVVDEEDEPPMLIEKKLSDRNVQPFGHHQSPEMPSMRSSKRIAE